MEKIGGAGLQECHKRSAISVQSKCDSSQVESPVNFKEGSLRGNSQNCLKIPTFSFLTNRFL